MQPNAPQFRLIRAAEYLCQREASAAYYAVANCGRKQFRRSLKTTDRRVVRRRLGGFVQEVTSRAEKRAGQTTYDAMAKLRRQPGVSRSDTRVSQRYVSVTWSAWT